MNPPFVGSASDAIFPELLVTLQQRSSHDLSTTAAAAAFGLFIIDSTEDCWEDFLEVFQSRLFRVVLGM